MAKKGAPIGNQNAKGAHRPGSRLASVYAGMVNKSYRHASETAHVGKRVHSGAHAFGGALRSVPTSAAIVGSAHLVGKVTGNQDIIAAGNVLALANTVGHTGKQYFKSKAGKTTSKFR